VGVFGVCVRCELGLGEVVLLSFFGVFSGGELW